MGTITRSFANNITTSGILLPASLNNNSIANVTSYNPAIATGNMVLLSTQTASNSSSLSFTTGIDSTYKEYQFWFIDIHARTNGTYLAFQASTNGGSSYGITMTTTDFYSAHNEADSGTNLLYNSDGDLSQSTSFKNIMYLGNGADENGAGSLQLYNPSSTTYVKHFISNTNGYITTVDSYEKFNAGYFNTTTAINAIRFQMSSGNFDGTILMYGIV